MKCRALRLQIKPKNIFDPTMVSRIMTAITTLTSANATVNIKTSMIQAYGTTVKRATNYMKAICIENKEYEQLQNVKNFFQNGV